MLQGGGAVLETVTDLTPGGVHRVATLERRWRATAGACVGQTEMLKCQVVDAD